MSNRFNSLEPIQHIQDSVSVVDFDDTFDFDTKAATGHF